MVAAVALVVIELILLLLQSQQII
jgi:hypothetical protein